VSGEDEEGEPEEVTGYTHTHFDCPACGHNSHVEGDATGETRDVGVVRQETQDRGGEMSERIPLLCRVFGHKVEHDTYGNLKAFAVDGLGHQHASVIYRCRRCDAKFRLVNVFLPGPESYTARMAAAAAAGRIKRKASELEEENAQWGGPSSHSREKIEAFREAAEIAAEGAR
jgi:DNA-directed RNA polymerase subunit RPC12/RpoP